MNIAAKDSECLFFEVLERTLRLYSHVESSCAQASNPNRRKTAQETIAETLKARLTQNLELLINIFYKDGLSEQERVGLLHIAMASLADLHRGPLAAVPRPHEPIELVSYIRQAFNSYPKNENVSFAPPYVFAGEMLGDQAHASFDQSEVNILKEATDFTVASKKPGELGKLAEKFLSPSAPISASSKSQDHRRAIGFISLPRIDLGNPLRWPSLMHEAGHFEAAANPDALWKEFCGIEEGAVSSRAVECMKRYLAATNLDKGGSEAEIRKWLVECWCDAHSASVAGAPALLAQMHAFLFSIPCYLTESSKGGGYPPAWFRLRLMRALITTRHLQDTVIKDMIAQEWSMLERLFLPPKNADVRHNSDLLGLFDYFQFFLTRQFPQEKWLPQSTIDPNDLNELIKDLSQGLPIPTRGEVGKVTQNPASHAEILLTGWWFRSNDYKKSLLKIVNERLELSKALLKFLAIVDRADAALQMSIQVSEWFDILKNPDEVSAVTQVEKQPEPPAATGSDPISSGLLTDREIVQMLSEKSLRIIPLIGGINGIMGTAIDLRLGHNFEIFFSNISGTVDALHRDRGDAVDSMEVDYDSLDGLEIAPGQFVLGHTLEYLKLPANVAAQIEGRSSFARLGLQVHMTANLVEAGFDGCLTFEIANAGHSTIKLYPGMRIAQLRLFRCTSSPRVPYGERPEDKYRGGLRHNKTKQFNDWEITAFEKAGTRRRVGQ